MGGGSYPYSHFSFILFLILVLLFFGDGIFCWGDPR
ncbi:MAG: hypothetical protein PWP72_1436 [Thermoanaerobacter sp.]|jgi:hypothetical protein|nr:hypothetical protein [Thermoanaerobacter sp.]